jgi:hypothetical protein
MNTAAAIDMDMMARQTETREDLGQELAELNASVRDAGNALAENARVTADVLKDAIVEINDTGTPTKLMLGLELLNSVLTLTQSIIAVTNNCPEEIDRCVNQLSQGFIELDDLFNSQAPLNECTMVITNVMVPALERMFELHDIWSEDPITLSVV